MFNKKCGEIISFMPIFFVKQSLLFSIAVDVIAAFTGNWFFLNMCSRQKAGEFDYSVIV